ncbi:MAG: YicC family protein [Muribaculaceae bacterium]|jgi:uncharacterized protein (TIGR00255 family)|nr:YicC family protein [Muribaculaceae bacterium]
MILSMTGFGKAVTQFSNKKITAEIKSLNSKQLDLSVRLPQAYREKELDLRNMVSQTMERGKVDLYIYTEAADGATPAKVNIELISAYKSQIEQLSKKLGIAEPTDWYGTLLRMPDAIVTDANDPTIEKGELEAVAATVEKAIKALIEFRTQEGNRLAGFFREKIENIGKLLDEDVEPYEKERIEKIKTRIMDSLSKLDGVDYDRNRFEQELIYYIDKLDITEEKLRLRNHLDYFLKTLETGHGQGKKLGFISQEMGREINTLGSKSNHAELQKVVVRMKDELEQIKEQVLNVL